MRSIEKNLKNSAQSCKINPLKSGFFIAITELREFSYKISKKSKKLSKKCFTFTTLYDTMIL